MSKQLIEAILALKKRVEVLEKENSDMKAINEQEIETYNQNLQFIAERLDQFDAKLEALSAPPAVVDADGVINDVAGALVSDFDAFKSVMKKQVDELKGWFHTHLQDHEINGGRPKMLTGHALHEVLKNMNGPTL